MHVVEQPRIPIGRYAFEIPAARRNHLLAALPYEECSRIWSNLELVELPGGSVLHQSGERVGHVYFPTTAIVSLCCVLGGDATPHRAVVQNGGHGFRLPSQLLAEECRRGGAMQQLLLRYTQALSTLVAQTAICSRHHSLDQQFCRCLLLALDRSPSNELSMTQELIGNRLGVRRESVTDAAGKLRRAGLIDYRRGRIAILDRDALEARSCECYGVVKREFDRLLSPRSTPQQRPRWESRGSPWATPAASTRRV
jgi:Crp-like helix-turn-helix domain